MESRLKITRKAAMLLGYGAVLLFFTGCSLNRAAVNMIGDALAGGGGGAYASDDDPEFVRDALPFGLKLFESLLAVSPDHRGLLVAASQGFASYAFLLQNDADRLGGTDPARGRELRARSRNLYLRGREYALRGLETRHPAFLAQLKKDSSSALLKTTKEDLPFLYWAGASWGGAVSAAKNDLELIAELPLCGALIARVLELDEGYDLGGAHEIFISYEAGRPGGSIAEARAHYRKALEISGGERATVHLALAESVSVREQNLAEFRALLAAALAVDAEKNRELRLVNTIARRRALWLDSRIPDLFIEAEEKEK